MHVVSSDACAVHALSLMGGCMVSRVVRDDAWMLVVGWGGWCGETTAQHAPPDAFLTQTEVKLWCKHTLVRAVWWGMRQHGFHCSGWWVRKAVARPRSEGVDLPISLNVYRVVGCPVVVE